MQRALCLILGVIFIIFGYTTIDQPVTLFFSRMPKEALHFASVFSWLVAPEVHLVAWPILFFSFFYLLRNQKMHSLLIFAIGVPASILIIDILKVVFGRARPMEWLHEGIYGFTWIGMEMAYWSFPSGHAASIGAVMGVISCFKPRSTILCFLVAILLALSRVLELKHFFSDIVCGVWIAFIITQFIYKTVHERKSLKNT